MLDDLKLIHNRDSRDMLGSAGKRWQQLSRPLRLDADLGTVGQVVVVGAGIAACSARLALGWGGLAVPSEIRDFGQLPAYFGQRTLCVVVVTAEADARLARESLELARGAGASAVVMAPAGGLAEMFQGSGYHVVELPSDMEQQLVVPLAVSLWRLFARQRLLAGGALEEDVDRAAQALHQVLDSWGPEVATAHNPAKQLALELAGKSTVIEAGPTLSAAAEAWKILCNRNAKHVAWTSAYPRSQREELAGWTKQPVVKPYAIVSLRSSLDDRTVVERYESARRLLSGKRPEPDDVQAVGSDAIEQSLYAVGLGEFVSLYLALLAGLDPAVSETLDKFDKEVS